MSSFMRSALPAVLWIPSLLFSSVAFAQEMPPMHPVAIEHLPFFITAPGQTDILFNVMAVFLLVVVLAIGNLYFQLHAVPERMSHRTSKVQMELVAVLALISLITHNHLFWIAALLLAMVEFPDYSTPMQSIANSLEKLVGRRDIEQAMATGSAPVGASEAFVEPPERPALEHDPHRAGSTGGAHAPKEGN